MIRQLHPYYSPLLVLAVVLLVTPAKAADAGIAGGVVAGDVSAWQRYQLRHVNNSMSDIEYRKTSRKNRKRILNFIETYSESNLVALGIPRKGVQLLGAAAAVAITQDARLYLGKSKLMAVEVKNATEDNRSIFLGFNIKW